MQRKISGMSLSEGQDHSSPFLQVFGEAVCCSSLPEVMYGIKKKFIPKKAEACWQRSLHKAWWQAFEEASDALLFSYLQRTIHQATITPHLRVRVDNIWHIKNICSKNVTICRRAYLSKVNSGSLKAPHLQSLLEEVKGVCDCFAYQSSSTATEQAPQISLKKGHIKSHKTDNTLRDKCYGWTNEF